MLVVRGENIYPSAIEDVLRDFPELGTEFEIIVSRPKSSDELMVRAEVAAPCDEAVLRERVMAQLKRRLGIRAESHSQRRRAGADGFEVASCS